MEVRSDGKISWYIGAIGGSGTYTLDGDHLTTDLKQATKDLTSESQDWTVDFKIAAAGEDVMLTMAYEEVAAAWVGAMNNIRNRAEEIILREIIYEEGAV